MRVCQEDIMPLAEFFRDIANKELECNVSGFCSEARKALLSHAWPGNVRKLKRKVQTVALQAEGEVITEYDLELNLDSNAASSSFALKNAEEEKERILRALKQAGGNRRVAVRLLGISRTNSLPKNG